MDTTLREMANEINAMAIKLFVNLGIAEIEVYGKRPVDNIEHSKGVCLEDDLIIAKKNVKECLELSSVLLNHLNNNEND